METKYGNAAENRKKIFAMHARGMTQSQIYEALKEDGARTEAGTLMSARYIRWCVWKHRKGSSASTASASAVDIAKLKDIVLRSTSIPAEKRIEICLSIQ